MIVSKHISLEATFIYFGRMHQNRLVILKLMSWWELQVGGKKGTT